MTGLGDRLKEARTEKGFTLDDLQSITKIQKRYLSGIENEDYSTMPGSFYVRAFIKQYAEAVGLDSEEILSLYKESVPVDERDIEKKQTALTRTKIVKGSNRFVKMMPKITVALFIIAIIVVAYVLYKSQAMPPPPLDVEKEDPITIQDNNRPENEDGTSNPNVDEEDNELPEKVDSEPEKPVQELTSSSVNGEISTYALTNTDVFMLEIRASGRSWIGVLDSSKAERMERGAREMKADEVVQLDVSDTDSVRIRIGYTPTTEIYVNGELLEYVSERTTQTVIIEYVKE